MSTEQVKVIYNPRDKIIIVNAIKYPTPETMRDSVKQIMELRAIHNCESVLIDATRVKSLPSISNMHSFGTDLIKIPDLKNIRLVFAISDDISDSFKFFDNVIHNRGINVHIFKDFGKAKDWLLKQL